MEKGKITADMRLEDVVWTMSEGNPGAITVLTKMLQHGTKNYGHILLCDDLNIRGSKLYCLYNYCCNRDYKKFDCTLNMFGNGVFSEEEIHTNLELRRPIQFIDDSIETIDELNQNILAQDLKGGLEEWEKFCGLNKASFELNLDMALAEENSYNRIETERQTKSSNF
ncbi:MAG: hypothetical protein IJI43_03795 [Bacilli bacterium]|nr:hypothetical protein [Bacilli bacterium]